MRTKGALGGNLPLNEVGCFTKFKWCKRLGVVAIGRTRDSTRAIRWIYVVLSKHSGDD